MSTPEARTRLGQAQAELVRSLVGQGEPPAGFDEPRLALAARSLVGKRLRESARAWPACSACLGERWRERFRVWASQTPPPAAGGPRADGRAFLRTVPRADLDDDARLELLWADLLTRRGFAVRTAWLPGRRRLAVGVRWPWGGVWVMVGWSVSRA